MKDLKEWIVKADLMIRNANIADVATNLKSLPTSKLDREDLLPLAKLCRRAGLPQLGLKILSPLFFTQKRSLGKAATEEEKAEYSILLMRCGMPELSYDSLVRIDSQKAPQALLYTGFSLFAMWEYRRAIEPLNRYIQLTENVYDQLVGKLNLAACYVHEIDPRAWDLLEDISQTALEQKYLRIFANTLELKAKHFIQLEKWSEARKHIETARIFLGQQKIHDQLFLDQWTAVLDSFESGNPQPLVRFRKIATERKDHEAIREADLFRLKVKFDIDLFLNLYLGTPHSGYRQRILKILNRNAPTEVLHIGIQAPDGSAPSIDLQTGLCSNGTKLKGKVFQVLRVLTMDLYKSKSIGFLFSRIFPDSVYDPYSSPSRIHQIIRATKKWIVESQTPIDIVFIDEGYSLEFKDPFIFTISSQNIASKDTYQQRRLQILENLKNVPQTPDGYIIAGDIQHTLNISKSATQTWLKEALSQGHIQKSGKGPSTRYKIVS